MKDDLFGNDYDEQPPGRDHLFLWTVGILLLIGLAFATWLGSFYIFGHPEKPDSYRILQKLGKLQPPKRFELTKAPPGEFLSPQKAFDRFNSLSDFELRRENEALLRDYIKNYDSTKRLVPYLTGRFSIMNSYELKESDFFGSGVIAVSQSVDVPQVVLEHVYTAGPRAVPILEQMLATGLDIKLERMTDLAAVIHVDRMNDGRLQFTVVPLLYGSYALKQGSGSFTLEPPAILNPAGGLPIVRDQLLADCVKSYADFLRVRSGRSIAAGGAPSIPVAQPASETTIVRVATPSPTPAAEPEATPAASEAKPGEGQAVAVAKPEATPPPVFSEEEPEIPRAVPVATPSLATARVTPRPAAAATPAPISTPALAAATPPPQARPAVAVAAPAATPLLQPFLVASPTPGITAAGGGNWRTYAPGQMPRGRLISLSEAADLAERGTGGERTYLRGNFVVTATGDNRAVLRSNSTLGNVIGTVTKQPVTRVIVEFPSGAVPPSERSSISRDGSRPFEVRSVQRGADGQINIYVREVTSP